MLNNSNGTGGKPSAGRNRRKAQAAGADRGGPEMAAGAQERCTSCGGRLVQKSRELCRCASCGREYYLSVDREPLVSVRLSAGKTLIICAAVLILITAVAVAGYRYYTADLVQSASRFSVVFRDFVMEVYGKPVAAVTGEELAGIRYLKIEKEDGYRFTCSFEDYYAYEDSDDYGKTLREVVVAGSPEDFSPSNVEFFTGLTKLELYTEAWENYRLPEKNLLRSISCIDGLSRYGTPHFFEAVNPDTLEEVVIAGAGGLSDFSFLEKLRRIRRFTLEEAELKQEGLFDGFEKLEELTLRYPAVKEEDIYRMVENILMLPSLQRFELEGKAAWYLTDAQWEELSRNNQGALYRYYFTEKGIVVERN